MPMDQDSLMEASGLTVGDHDNQDLEEVDSTEEIPSEEEVYDDLDLSEEEGNDYLESWSNWWNGE